jgi:hypothetical protein
MSFFLLKIPNTTDTTPCFRHLTMDGADRAS